jgi:hypothetical protein
VHFPVHLSPSLPRVFPCAVNTELPYYPPEPHQLTERLRHQWLRIRAQNCNLCRVSHSLDLAHVELNVPLTHNINSDSQSKVATSVSLVERRGEQNVPKRYLKDAEWCTDKYLGHGYYIADPDEDNTFCCRLQF